jgi:two-component system, chemotaxis family, sensor kinase CheA
MDELAEIRSVFFEECAEFLENLDGHVGAIEKNAADAETINASFRAIHSIKGGAGAFALVPLINFAHLFETVLDAMRSGRLQATPDVAAVLRRAADRLADHVAAAQSGLSPPPPDALEGELQQLAGQREEADLEALFSGPEPQAESLPSPPPAAELVTMRLDLRPRRDLFRRAVEPSLLIKALKDYGRVKVKADTRAVPRLADLDPEDCWLAFEIEIETDASRDVLASVLEPFLDQGEVSITGPADEPPRSSPATSADDGRKRKKSGKKAPSAVAPAAQPPPLRSEPTAAPDPVATAGPALPAKAAAPPSSPAAGPAETRQAGMAGGGSIRVDTGRIDRLVNLVGEIVVVQALLAEQMSLLDASRHGGLVNAITALSRRSRELHEAVMAVRAQPVKTVFQRMPRLIRELCQLLGKEVRLVLAGEQTEVDKTIIEELAEPLTHMLRNSMDHGIEPSEERVRQGKPAEGTIELAAEQRGGRILITISDDGRGIDRDRLLAKAVAAGLVSEGARLAPEDIDALIFHPGLSTAAKVSGVSGRGVGMDVVKRSIQGLGGRIMVHSEPGRGCRFTLALPLTLAVLDGMVIRVGKDRYVLPLQSVVETLRASKQLVESLPAGPLVLRLRDQLAPLLDLQCLLGLCPESEASREGVILVTETDNGLKLALRADEILGQQQVVVKSLEQSYGRIQGVSGASILGDGRVSLILDVDALPALAGGIQLGPAGIAKEAA